MEAARQRVRAAAAHKKEEERIAKGKEGRPHQLPRPSLRVRPKGKPTGRMIVLLKR